MQFFERWGGPGLLARWRLWHSNDRAVAHAAQQHNTQVLRWAAPALAALGLLGCAAYALSLLRHDDPPALTQAKLLSLALHGLAGLACAALALSPRAATPHSAAPWLGHAPTLLAATVLMWTALAGACANPADPALFCLGAVGSVALLRLPPRRWAGLLAVAAAGGLLALWVAPSNCAATAAIDLVLAAALAWGVSTLLWDAFVRLRQQQAALDQAQQSLATQQRELLRLTRLDGLTQLYNRRTFVELAEQELARARRQRLHTSIVLLDVDWFKHVNDTWGHPAGDAVLKHLAAVASASVRSTDLIGRLGGEEFIVLLPGTPAAAARTLAEKLRRAVAGQALMWQNTTIVCTISLGVASTDADQQLDFDTLYSQADAALYQAKAQGRNRVVVASPGA